MSSTVGVMIASVILGLVVITVLALHIAVLMVFIFHPNKLNKINKEDL